MSLSNALSNAVSGLGAASRRAETISDNIANAMTDGYARREVVLSARVAGGRGAGVEVADVARRVDPRLSADRRAGQAQRGEAQALAAAEKRIAAALGAPGEPGSLPALASAFENALARLAEAPESAPLQADAASSAGRFAEGLRQASGEVQRLRAEADAAIAGMVEEANDALAAVEALNDDIMRNHIAGRPTAALEEAREREVDRLGELMPVRIAKRPEGRISLYAPGGGILLDGRASRLSFSPADAVTADMTLASGALSGLSLDGRPITVGTGDGPLDGGALGARFAVRDRLAPEASAQLDAIAADLIRRYEDPGTDPTLAPGDPGLFTDAGGALDPADTVGLAGRLALNGRVDPAAGGEIRRMRDGLQSAGPGPAGEDDLPRALLAAFSRVDAAPTGSGLTGVHGFGALTESLAALRMGAEAEAERLHAFQEGRLAAAREAEAAFEGVDADREMSDLLAVEQAYAANARVIEAVDGLLRRLLEI